MGSVTEKFAYPTYRVKNTCQCLAPSLHSGEKSLQLAPREVLKPEKKIFTIFTPQVCPTEKGSKLFEISAYFRATVAAGGSVTTQFSCFTGTVNKHFHPPCSSLVPSPVKWKEHSFLGRWGHPSVPFSPSQQLSTMHPLTPPAPLGWGGEPG